jgi:diguanylate cyclase (GGDEF)-like protein
MDYIVKPFHLAVVKARVQNHISLKMKTDMLESLALVDGLTGIANRRRFDATLETEWKRAQRSGTDLAIVMADIDFFKNYNDHYGHGAGDQCLKAVAQALAGALGRPSDIFARYGGEEFVSVMPDTDGRGARQLAERCCANVTALGLTHRFSSAADHVTISAGYAALQPAAGQSNRELLEMADKMLYQAKEKGRNRVCG